MLLTNLSTPLLLIIFSRLFPNFLPRFPHVIVTKDFNVDLYTPQSLSLNDLFKSYVLQLVSNKPIHHTIKPDGTPHHTCLDVVLTRDLNTIGKFYQSQTPFTHGYDLIAIHLNILPVPPRPTFFFTRKLHDTDSDLLNNLITQKLNTSPTPQPVNLANITPLLPSIYPAFPLIDVSLPFYHSVTKTQLEAHTDLLTQLTMAAFSSSQKSKN